jgi:hypothetical protein
MLSHMSFYCQNELQVSSQRFLVSSQQKKSAVSDFFKFSANQVSSQQSAVSSQQNEVRSQ